MDAAERARVFQENVNAARAARGKDRVTVTVDRAPAEQLYPCRYLLPIIEKTDAAGIECSCPGKWLRGCEIHGQCRIDQESVDGCCRTCEQRPV